MESLLILALALELRRRRKQSAREIQQLRQEMAHISRVTTLSGLAGSLSHDLKQPLTAICSNVQAARRFLAAEPPFLGEVCEILASIEQDGERAGEMIERVRGLLKKGEWKPELLSFNDIVQDVVHLLRGHVVARGASLRIEAAPDLPRVSGDRAQLLQVLLNLALNAVEAMAGNPAGARHLVLATRRAGPGCAEAIVRDSGRGIAPAEIERIFEPFYTTKREGLGIGLSITRSIVKAHGGAVWAENHPEGGAAFHVVLPVLGDGHPGGT